MRSKITPCGRVWLFRETPQEVLEYEEEVKVSVQKALGKCYQLEETLPFPAARKATLCTKYPEFFSHLTAEETRCALSAKQLFVQEVLGFPAMLADEMFPSLPADGGAAGEREGAEELFSRLCTAHEKVKHLSHEARLYALFGPLTYEVVYGWCLAVIKTHPDFEFVAPEVYQIAFARVAAARLFVDAGARAGWVLSYEEDYLKRGFSLLGAFFEIQNTPDVAGLDSAFGYEQFYVIYCVYARYAPGNDVSRPLTEVQLRAYNDFQYSPSYIRRAFLGAGFSCLKQGVFGLEDFVPFFLADVAYDSHPSLEYQFRVGDTASDGVLDLDEFLEFYRETETVLERKGTAVPREDLLTQMQDMVHFRWERDFRFTKGALLRSKMHQNLFDAMFSPAKLAQFEQRDPYVANPALVQAYVATHAQSGVWRAFWTQTYEAVTQGE